MQMQLWPIFNGTQLFLEVVWSLSRILVILRREATDPHEKPSFKTNPIEGLKGKELEAKDVH